ncbi:MAG: putative sulfate exporter family transporter [Phenylobacterium sp.]|uniref:YeiH family protein n=1 Tax=Phenylobacterium sp. TaxID=1871053 RepID=UPI0025F26464|nr:putative sulfate exporter family transporter [Phenylobacterium sp.]MBI1200131.1 putative sulfate exporter family transporter [Phenylobacterium sp.]
MSQQVMAAPFRFAVRIAPGLALCAAVALVAWALQGVEVRWFGRAWLEALVLAILAGAVVRTVWTPGAAWTPGVAFSAKTVLEIAVVLLGLTINAQMIREAGAPLLAGVAGLVAVAILVSYGLGRALRLPPKMAMLIACGNAICGNSAIAAVAPVIGAESDDVTAAIAFTAVLGVGVVLGVPLLAHTLHLSGHAAGVFAGLTVYAVPQVLAATAPIGPLSLQIGALVKLARVLMLGPVILILSLIGFGAAKALAGEADGKAGSARPPLHHLAPWFIVGFLLLAGARSMGWTPPGLVAPASAAATVLTVVSMAALGLCVDVRALVRAGPRVSAVVTGSLVFLAVLALALIHWLAPA